MGTSNSWICYFVVVVVVVDLVVDLADSGCELEESLRADPTERRSESATLPTAR